MFLRFQLKRRVCRQSPCSGASAPAILGSQVRDWSGARQGVVDAGIQCPHNEEIIPSEERILGKHLDDKIAPVAGEIKDKIIGGK